MLNIGFAATLGASALLPNVTNAQTASSPQTLSNNVAVTSISGSSGSQRYYKIDIPTGATGTVFSISGNNGDADLYVRYGRTPSTRSWDYRPNRSGSNETVSVNSPRAGTWYLMVRADSRYSGLTLKAQVNGAATAAAAATPAFTPAPGTYSGQVNVQLASGTPNAVVRYTLNGSTPTAASEVYTAPIMVTATTQVQAMAFANGYANSTVASGQFTITNTIQTLTNNATLSNRSGALNSTTNYKFAVPSGMSSVRFTIAGNSGDADLYVKYGQLASTSVWDQRPYTLGSNETVTINTPAAGDYYLMVHGHSAYSGLSITAVTTGTAAVGNKPDLAVNADSMNPYITTESFASSACEIQEGTISAGTKKLLRFTTQSQNLGTADLVLGNPANSALFEWGACHGHYHFRSFAQYRLLDSTGALVRTGKKVGFCLMDISRFSSTANPAARYTCSNQGIQAGWADIYSANLSGQWIDITGLPAGAYILEVIMDPMNLVDELNEANNTARVNVSIP